MVPYIAKDFETKHKEYKKRDDIEELNAIFRICNENIQQLKGYIPNYLLKDVYSVLQYEFEFWNVKYDFTNLNSPLLPVTRLDVLSNQNSS